MKKIRKRAKIVNDQTLLGTVDIGKEKNVGYMRTPDGHELMPFEFCNNIRGFEKFYHSLQWTKTKHGLRHVVVAFESTGPYGEPLLHYLKNKNIKLVQVNTMHTKRLKELCDNSPNKTDKKDPRVIADIVELGHVLSVVIPEGVAAELRSLIHARERLIDKRNVTINQLYDQVHIIFPEFEQVMKNFTSKSAQYLLKKHPTPEKIIELGLEALTTTLRKVSRGKIKSERAQALYQGAQESVGVKQGQASIADEITDLLDVISLVNEKISNKEKKISIELTKIPESKPLLAIPGIGEITVAGTLGEVAKFEDFSKIAEIEKFAGLNLFEISSGKHRGQRRISKRGRHLLRKILFFATLNTIRKGGIFHDKYQSYLDRGMLKKKAVVAISRKLLRVMFAIMRDHKEFDITYVKLSEISKAA